MSVKSADWNTFLFANRRLYQEEASALESLDLWFLSPLLTEHYYSVSVLVLPFLPATALYCEW